MQRYFAEQIFLHNRDGKREKVVHLKYGFDQRINNYSSLSQCFGHIFHVFTHQLLFVRSVLFLCVFSEFKYKAEYFIRILSMCYYKWHQYTNLRLYFFYTFLGHPAILCVGGSGVNVSGFVETEEECVWWSDRLPECLAPDTWLAYLTDKAQE